MVWNCNKVQIPRFLLISGFVFQTNVGGLICMGNSNNLPIHTVKKLENLSRTTKKLHHELFFKLQSLLMFKR